jgi:hypothetical protein
MLERLDAVRWSELTGRQGPRSVAELPSLIRQAASGPASERKAAVLRLREHLWNQGQVFDATAQAVPFLVELLPESPVAADLCLLLGLISEAVTYGPPGSVAQAQASFAAVRAGLPVYLELLRRSERNPAQAATLLYLVFHLHEDRETLIPLLRPLMTPALEWMIDIALSPPAPSSETRSAYGLLGAQAVHTLES